jgi:hypothetical protein
MRLRTTFLAVALLALSASNASAYRMFFGAGSYSGGALGAGSGLSVNINLDTEGMSAIQIISVSVNYDPNKLEYVPDESFTPSYILYSPSEGSGKTGLPSVYLLPGQDPPEIWGGNPHPVTGFQQINVNFFDPDLTGNGTRAVEGDVFMAHLVFVALVDLNNENTTPIGVDFLGGGNVFRAGGLEIEEIGLPEPITVPEPTMVVLSLVSLLTVQAIRRSRARR